MKLCNKITHKKLALNANKNICTVVSLKMLSIIEIDNTFLSNQIYIFKFGALDLALAPRPENHCFTAYYYLSETESSLSYYTLS